MLLHWRSMHQRRVTIDAYKAYDQVKLTFAGYQLPPSVNTEWSRLKDDESIATEIEGMKLWQTAQQIISSGRATPARTTAMMEKIIERFPGTEAASLAEKQR
jgi:hypothetical protein